MPSDAPSMTAGLPLRGDGSVRPAGLALPPARMPLLHDRRPLKRWRYVGVYGAELMLCAAAVRIAGIPQAFWAVLDRASGALHGRTAFTRGLVAVGDGHLAVRGRGVDIDLALTPRRRADRDHQPARRLVHLDAQGSGPRARTVVRRRADAGQLDAAGLIDASAGYHARATTWRWAAGVGHVDRRAGGSAGTSSPASTTSRRRASARSGSAASRARSGPSASPATSTA